MNFTATWEASPTGVWTRIGGVTVICTPYREEGFFVARAYEGDGREVDGNLSPVPAYAAEETAGAGSLSHNWHPLAPTAGWPETLGKKGVGHTLAEWNALKRKD